MTGCAPDQIELGAVLAAVEDASRRLRRSPAAILDRRCARRLMRACWVGTEKRRSVELRNVTAKRRHPILLNLTDITHTGNFVAAEIVGDDDVARC